MITELLTLREEMERMELLIISVTLPEQWYRLSTVESRRGPDILEPGPEYRHS